MEGAADKRPLFLNLPPELRNDIYKELLTFRQCDPKSRDKACHTSILAVCKQTYQEAEGLLNNVDHVEIRMKANNRHTRGAASRETDLGDSHQCFEVWFNDASIFEGLRYTTAPDIRWPKSLRKARSISLVVELHSAIMSPLDELNGRWRFWDTLLAQINGSLHSLYTFLYVHGFPTTLNIRYSLFSGFSAANGSSRQYAH